MATTMQDIARALDLSVATVSRSLRHDPLIRSQTRARVHETALKLGYQTRSADRKRTDAESGPYALGVLLQIDGMPKRDDNEILIHLLEGISAEADLGEAVLNLHSVGFADRGKMAINAGAVPRMIRDGLCAACIVQGTQFAEDVAVLAAHLPLVTISRTYPGVVTAAVIQDNIHGICYQVENLAALGHRRLAWIPDSYLSPHLEERRVGFLLGCQKGDLPLDQQLLFATSDLYDGSRQIDGKALVEAVRTAGITGLICANDHVAQSAAQVLLDAGFDIPGDISLTGFDADSAPLPNGRALTTSDPHFNRMGRLAVRLAIQCIEHPEEQAERRFVACSFVEGASVAPLRS